MVETGSLPSNFALTNDRRRGFPRLDIRRLRRGILADRGGLGHLVLATKMRGDRAAPLGALLADFR